KVRKLATSYDEFLKQFYSFQFDIGLAPLDDSVFSQCKNNTKFRDYGACGVAGIYSDVPVYSNSVIDGVTGLLVQNSPDGWCNALLRLSLEHDLRERVRTSARQHVSENYRQSLIEKTWLSDLLSVLPPRWWYRTRTNQDPWRTRRFPVVEVKATRDNLCGLSIDVTDMSLFQDRKWGVRVMTERHDLIRDVEEIKVGCAANSLTFNFAPIANTRGKLLRVLLIPADHRQTSFTSTFSEKLKINCRFLYEGNRLIE
ncbi:MAG: glycosyltransferase, partial [Cyanobacteria bacterium]|nr:glycosyltransferase [Cyanobacteriota bacterium]